MLKIAEFSIPRLFMLVARILLFLLVVWWAIGWALSLDSSTSGRTIVWLALCAVSSLLALGLVALLVAAPFRQQRAAIYILQGEVTLFDGAFFRTAPLASVREVNVPRGNFFQSLLQGASVEVVLNSYRRVHAPLSLIRGDAQAIRQRLWDEVQAAKAQDHGAE